MMSTLNPKKVDIPLGVVSSCDHLATKSVQATSSGNRMEMEVEFCQLGLTSERVING